MAASARLRRDRGESSITTINHTPGVCGGSACVNDTRIAVWLIAQCFNQHGGVEGTVEHWVWDDGLSRDDVLGAIDWYQKHRAEVDRDILENQRALDELKARS